MIYYDITRPLITHRYEKKIRLLVTTNCFHNCPFCHNEGQKKRLTKDLHIISLDPFLPMLRNFSNQITLSGGEPLHSPNISDIVSVLYKYNFDITLDTAGDKILDYIDIIKKIRFIHISIISLNKKSILSNCNGDYKKKIEAIKVLKEKYPTLKICLNIRTFNIKETSLEFNNFLDLAYKLNVKLKFISEFRFTKSLNNISFTNWEERWGYLLYEIKKHRFKYIDSDPREVEFENDKGVIVELSEIPCSIIDKHYSFGRCFDNMDITIDPQLNLKMCRWQNNSVSLKKVINEVTTLEDQLIVLTERDSNTCPFNISNHPIASDNKNIAKYAFVPHNNWPPYFKDSTDMLSVLVNNNEISYFGKSNIIANLENEFAEYHNVNYALTVSSGTAALFIAYLLLGFTNNAEVIVPILSYPGTVTPLLITGANIKFCDVESDSGNIDLNNFENLITDKTKGVIVTHLWGNLIDMEQLIKICNNHNIKLVEDCSHSIGSEINNKKVGTFGDIGCFSLQSNKLVFAGEGGVLITKDQSLYENAVLLTSLRKRVIDCVQNFELKKYWETGLGLKLKIHPLGAAYALSSLRKIEEIIENRKIRFDLLYSYLEDLDEIIKPQTKSNITRKSYYSFNPLLSDEILKYRDLMVNNLILNCLEVKIPDNIPLHHTNFFKKIESKNQKNIFEGANKYYSRIINFPSFTFEPFDLIEYYGKIFRKEVISVACSCKKEIIFT